MRSEPVGEEGPRSQARERALALLYEAELRGVAPVEVLGDLMASPDPYAVQLVKGVSEHQATIDGLIDDAVIGWEIDRLAVVDRQVLRLAVFELLGEAEVPVAVIIDEAVELAKEYSTEESGGFVNGILSTVARRLRP